MGPGLRGTAAMIAGSSRGIGFAIAEAFTRGGARVVITGREEAALESARTHLADRYGKENVASLCGDMTDERIVSETLDQAISLVGPLDAVVANVGSGSEPGGWDLGRDHWQKSFNTNLFGSMALARAALNCLCSRGCGSVTLVASIAGLECINAPVAYSAAKSALISAMKSLARLAGPKGVRVNAVAPGNVLFPGGVWAKKLEEREDYVKSYIKSEVALQRFGRPEEIADAVVFLASERASFITGTCLVVDGGQTRAW